MVVSGDQRTTNLSTALLIRHCLKYFIFYGSETWCLRENEMAILRRTKTAAVVRAMCGAKLMDKKRAKDLMEMLGLSELVLQMTKANGVRWYGYDCVEEG